MSERTQRPPMDDELEQAYARAQALLDEGRGPGAAVRANVLAAARDVAAHAAASPAMAPAAPPVAQVGHGRGDAGNRSSWRLRSGAAICAALVVGVLAWRWETGRQPVGDVTVAAAGDAASPPALPGPSAQVAAAPLQVPVPKTAQPAPLRHDAAVAAAARRKAVPAPDVVVAQADAPKAAPEAATAPDVPAPRSAMTSAPPAPAPVAPPRDAAQETERKANLTTARMVFAAKASVRPTSLCAAADRGDVESLKALLAVPAAQVDAPDPGGATALLHAVQAQQAAAVRLLLASGADPDHADAAGLTPRAAARAGASPEIAALLAAPR